jgi:hypothetical protein
MEEEAALFLLRTSALISSLATGSQIKEAEIYISRYRRTEAARAFTTTTFILRQKQGPEALLAAQTILWVSENTLLSTSQLNVLVDLLAKSTSFGSSSDLVAQTLTRALASALILSRPATRTGGAWLYDDYETIVARFRDGREQGTAAGAEDRARRVLLAVVAALPEASCGKHLIEAWTSRLEYANMNSQLMSKMLLCGSLLAEAGAAVDLAGALFAAGDAGSCALCAHCCTTWLDRAEAALRDSWEFCAGQSVPSELSAAATQACASAVRCVAAWAQSAVVQGVMLCLLASGDSGVAHLVQDAKAHESCLGMLVALCRAVACDGPHAEAPPHGASGVTVQNVALAPVSKNLRVMAAQIAVQLLPVLPALLVTPTAQLRAAVAQQARPLSAAAIAHQCAAAARGMRCAIECADAILHQTFFSEGSAAEQAAWEAFLTHLLSAQESHLVLLAQVAKGSEPDIRSAIREHGCVLVECALPFIIALVEEVTVPGYSGAELHRAALGALERLAVIAISACAYPQETPDEAGGLQVYEEFEEFR